MKTAEKYWVWLSSIEGMTPLRGKELLRRLGSPERIWQLSREELKSEFYIPEPVLDKMTENDREEKLQALMNKIQEYHLRIIHQQHTEYPALLKNIHDPPLTLYTKGTLSYEEKAIAIVGSREASPYGMKVAEALSRELAKCGITIVSGMARGIDTYAHHGALQAGGRTLAIMGCGAEQVYPRENKVLMKQIIDSGAVLSEYPPGTPPLAFHFPARNRIISGISMGVIVIEASEKSGSLITADFALEQGREVFAIPGNVNSSTSKGTNKLIREGAKIVTCIEDILEEIRVFRETPIDCFEPETSEKFKLLKNLMPEERSLMKFLFSEPLHIDQLASKCGMEIKSVISLLLMLELKGLVEPLPGKIFKFRE